MTAPDGIRVIQVDQLDPRLGRQIVHDPQSRRFAFPRTVELPTRSFRHRLYQPSPIPRQRVGCCSCVDQLVKCNAQARSVLYDMDDAEDMYRETTRTDPYEGEWPPDDTGSSALAACKVAKRLGRIDRYEWIFNGVDGILTALPHRLVGIGTFWHRGMFHPDPDNGLVEVSGRQIGGHQWTAVGYNRPLDAIEGVCWWGAWGMNDRGLFRIRRNDLAELMEDFGDAHVTY